MNKNTGTNEWGLKNLMTIWWVFSFIIIFSGLIQLNTKSGFFMFLSGFFLLPPIYIFTNAKLRLFFKNKYTFIHPILIAFIFFNLSIFNNTPIKEQPINTPNINESTLEKSSSKPETVNPTSSSSSITTSSSAQSSVVQKSESSKPSIVEKDFDIIKSKISSETFEVTIKKSDNSELAEEGQLPYRVIIILKDNSISCKNVKEWAHGLIKSLYSEPKLNKKISSVAFKSFNQFYLEIGSNNGYELTESKSWNGPTLFYQTLENYLDKRSVNSNKPYVYNSLTKYLEKQILDTATTFEDKLELAYLKDCIK